MKPTERHIQQLEERIAALEETNRWHTFALELITSVTDIHGSDKNHQTAEEILQVTVRHLKRLAPFEVIAFMRVNEDDSSFYQATCDPASESDAVKQEVAQQIEEGTFAWALNQNNAIIAHAQRPGYSLILNVIATRTRIRGMFIALMPGHYPNMSNNTLNLLSIILNNTAHALESAALYQLIRQQNQTLEGLVDKRTKQLAYQAGHDALTGLPNRLMLIEQMEKALTPGKKVSILLLDLDQFKRLNDTLGHPAGDHLIQQVSQRLQSLLRTAAEDKTMPDSTLARLGGDEFVILLEGPAQDHHEIKLIRHIIESGKHPYTVEGHEVHLSLSIGLAKAPEDGNNTGTLLRNAETAMYYAKRHGRNTYQFYSPEMNSKALERLVLENQLRHAIERNELLLHYQPQVDVTTGRIIGVEALVRWHQPEIGMVSPLQFIPLAEENGLILPIGTWVLRTACAQIAELQRQGLGPLQIAVNLSPHQFKQRELKQIINDTLEETGLNPEHLELELTESALMDDMKAAIHILHELRELGVKISIDDFGTGYSSLNYLKTFPLDSLKIDQTFVHDMMIDRQNETIVATMINLAHTLRLTVIAEGVEKQEQLDRLLENGCDLIQGYLFSRPLPFDALKAFLVEKKTS